MTNTRAIPDSFVAISDFHGVYFPLEKIKEHYLREYDKIFVLGDTTDRGLDGEGAKGIKMLEEIMELSKDFPDRVYYVPGNHDELLYEYIKTGSSNARYNITSNGGAKTVLDIDRMRVAEPERLEKLTEWLESQPLQREHFFNGQRYVFAHAFFNQQIFQTNKNFSLKDLYQSKRTGKYNKYDNILWYRKGSFNNLDEVSKAEVPADAVMVIGHTPPSARRGVDLSLPNAKGTTTKVHCVDGGIFYSNQIMKYDGGFNPVVTVTQEHYDTSPKKGDILTEEDLEDALDVMAQVSQNTLERHNINQVKTAYERLIYGDKQWPLYFSRGKRQLLYDVNPLAIKQVFVNLSGEEKSVIINTLNWKGDYL